jgi:delta 1-pyrroline-5-carboxylate dehydrogenase
VLIVIHNPLFQQELFVPITIVGDVLTLDEAIDLANRTEYGLTAGIFSEDDREIQEFFDRIQAGVAYANRRAGATSGAWPGINSFGGWKASGSTGRGEANLYGLCSFLIVEHMRRGMHPKDAGLEALKRVKANTIEKRLLNTRGLQDIVDWPEIERDNYDFREINTVVNSFLL